MKAFPVFGWIFLAKPHVLHACRKHAEITLVSGHALGKVKLHRASSMLTW